MYHPPLFHVAAPAESPECGAGEVAPGLVGVGCWRGEAWGVPSAVVRSACSCSWPSLRIAASMSLPQSDSTAVMTCGQ